jgi:hypothetical protein
MVRLVLAALLLPLLPHTARAQAMPEIVGCPEGVAGPVAQAAPRGPGPLALVRLDCLGLPGSPFSETSPAPSPDGAHVFTYNGVDGLRIAATDGAAGAAPPRMVEGRITNSLDRPPFAWTRDGQALWGVRQDVLPGGWSLRPLEPMLYSVKGGAQHLPALTHAAGGLDAVYWAGDRGKALAAFGTRGGYYRPEREDRQPTLAIVDAQTGRVLQSVAFADLPGPGVSPVFFSAAAGVDSAGRVHALLQFGAQRWLWWREGEAPRFVSIEGSAPSQFRSTFALAPDLHHVLLWRGLSATGMICERNPRCPPPTPVSGAIAELHEIATGRVLWSLQGTATNFASGHPPAISPDGRYALLSMPPENGEEPTALVSMADGRVLQLLPPGTPGFYPDGSVWISRGSQIARYRFQ